MRRSVIAIALLLALLGPSAALGADAGRATPAAAMPSFMIPSDELCFVTGADGNSIQVPVPDSTAPWAENVVCVLSEGVKTPAARTTHPKAHRRHRRAHRHHRRHRHHHR